MPTNSYQTEDVVRTLASVSGDAIFLIFAANWEGAHFLNRWLPRERYLLGYPDGGGTVREGICWTNLGCEAHLGEVEGKPSAKLEQVIALFRLLYANNPPCSASPTFRTLNTHQVTFLHMRAEQGDHLVLERA